MTDVNIWDRILSEQELSDWMFCRTETGGNVVSWQSAQLNITGLDTDLMDREETCPGPQNITHVMMVFTRQLNFFDSVKFCQKLGGQMAVATDKETSELMIRSHVEVCPQKKKFFSGFVDSDEKAEWKDVNNWASWLDGRPNRGRNAQCSVIKVMGGYSTKKCL